MGFISYSDYLFENEIYENLKYYYRWEQKNQVLQIVLMSDDKTIGYINPWLYENNNWEIVGVAAESGYGFKMHEIAMDFLYPDWIIPVRNKAIQPPLIRTYSKFIDRPDIENEKIEKGDPCYVEIAPEFDEWFNRRFRLKNKLNLEFEKVDYAFMKRTGVKVFGEKYPWGGKTNID